ncbi:SLATT domain-containing protein [Pectobacterium carotovorum]|uniref:SLATT domain-containing protein n=1 Tax=Pectobacterium carotovorum TaxID=554 RepID=UPI001F0D93F3|nr:SLATT domain-containing protein [Pectobacterium carotovorum]MCH4998129.1 SLATT domain-containing protein [Pectobacterium carotovorum]
MKWRSRYKRAQLAHSYTAISYGRYNLFLGVLLIIFTTASSILIFSSNIFPSWLSPTVGITAALLAYLQTFLQLSEKADTHREVARRYGSLKKNIEYIIEFHTEEQNLSKIVNEIRNKEDEIASDSPHALTHRWKKAKKETQQENDELSIRNRK